MSAGSQDTVHTGTEARSTNTTGDRQRAGRPRPPLVLHGRTPGENSDIQQTSPGNARAGDQDANGNAYAAGTPLPGATYPHSTENTRLEGKVTGVLSNKHTAILSYLDVDAVEQNQRFTSAIMDLRSLVEERQTPNTLLSLSYTGILTNQVFVEGQYAKKEFAFLGGGSPFTDNINGTLLQDRARGTRWWTPTFRKTDEGEHRDRELYAAKATYFLTTSGLGEIKVATSTSSGCAT
jgi:hypothetical protein